MEKTRKSIPLFELAETLSRLAGQHRELVAARGPAVGNQVEHSAALLLSRLAGKLVQPHGTPIAVQYKNLQPTDAAAEAMQLYCEDVGLVNYRRALITNLVTLCARIGEAEGEQPPSAA